MIYSRTIDNGIILLFGIFGMIWIEFVVSNHPAVHWQQVGDTAAALGLDRSREFKEYLARQKEVLTEAPGLPVMGAVLGGENIFQAALPSNGLVVIGNEGRGISPAVEGLLTHRLTIPRHPNGGAESLNAAVAAGIFAAAIRNP